MLETSYLPDGFGIVRVGSTTVMNGELFLIHRGNDLIVSVRFTARV